MIGIDLLHRTKSWKVRLTLIIILFTFFILLLPFLFSYWIWTRSNWNKKVRLGLIAGVWLFIALAGVISRFGQDSYQIGYKAGMGETSQVNSSLAQTTIVPTNTPVPLVEPTLIPTSTDITPSVTPQPSPVSESSLTPERTPYETLSEIGRDVAGDNSNVSTFKNNNGSIDVINNIQTTSQPPFGTDGYIRKWVTGFLSRSYTSSLKIRYVLVTVSFLHSGNPATRVGLGINRAKLYSDEEWEEFTPYDLCNWLKKIQKGDNMDPADQNYDPSDWAFAKNFKCS